MLSARFWLSALERALKSAAQVLLVIWPISDATLGLVDVDWKKSLSIAAMAAVASVLTSLVSAPVGPDGSPSLVGEPPKEPAALLEDDDAGAHALDGVGRGDAPEMPVSLFDKPTATRYDGDR